MDRRTLLAALAATAPLMLAHAEEGKEGHKAMGNAHGHTALIESASHCIAISELCVDHCLDMMAHGDNSMVSCMRTANSVIAVCTALRTLASQNAPATKSLAKVAAQVCEDCRKECDKHPEMAPCVACGKSCSDCAKACTTA